jgi:hypothetical protein
MNDQKKEDARLVRERDEAQCQRYELQQEVAALQLRVEARKERDELAQQVVAARAHFRRACELCEELTRIGQYDPRLARQYPSADMWQKQIEEEIKKEARKT